MKKLTAILFLITAVIFYTSCNKGDTLRNPDTTTIDSATIMGFKDSTQLIKSIHISGYDSASGTTDSATAYYFYDTVKRKITINYKEYPASSPAYEYSTENNYNSAGLLVHSDNAPLQPGEDSASIASMDITYDASNIIQTATFKYFNGQSYVITVNKTLLPSGNYQLSWLDTSPRNIQYNLNYLANFDSKWNLLSYYDISTSSSDSIIYDANGSVSKVVETFYTNPFNINGSNTFTLYHFLSRDTKGDQLYNLNQILYNGVDNIPPIADFGNGELSGDGAYQYSKYPVLSTDVNVGVNGYCAGCAVHLVNFNNSPQYDSKNRLIKYNSFFNDVTLSTTEVSISYYK